jgi:hypothetical protein
MMSVTEEHIRAIYERACLKVMPLFLYKHPHTAV